MDRRRLLAVSGALMAGALAGCTDLIRSRNGSITQASPGPKPDIQEGDLRELVHQTNGFTFDLYRKIVDDAPDENLFASPLSVSSAIAMTYAGARENTRSQMRDVLRYTLEDDELYDAFDTLQRKVAQRGDDVDVGTTQGERYDEDDDPVPFELSLVNSVWGQEDYPFEDAYLEVLTEFFDSEVHEVDYTTDPEAVRETINEWVADETEERIDELLPEDEIDELTRLVLVNAIYFFANWKHPFEESTTEEQSFTALAGTEHEVPMMRQNRSWEYAEIDGTQGVELPYIGDEVSMVVILPPPGTFNSYEQSFDGEVLADLVDALDSRDGTVQIPRFDYETNIELGAILESMGMEDAFDPAEADFGDMIHLEEVQETLSIDKVYHDGFVSVDEAGTEAAAATGVVMQALSAPADPFEFRADRPFLFVIRDRATDMILFVGRVVDPTDWE